jgi:hypothetical protein
MKSNAQNSIVLPFSAAEQSSCTRCTRATGKKYLEEERAAVYVHEVHKHGVLPARGAEGMDGLCLKARIMGCAT